MICINRDRERLVESHLEIVRYEVAAMCKRGDVGYLVRALGREEANAVGNLALCEAGQTFDFERGVQFKTYAASSIRKAVLTAAHELHNPDRTLDHEPTDIRADSVLDRDFLQRQLPDLSARENAVLQLRELQGLPWETVALRMGHRRQVVEKWHSSAIEKLRLRAVDNS